MSHRRRNNGGGAASRASTVSSNEEEGVQVRLRLDRLEDRLEVVEGDVNDQGVRLNAVEGDVQELKQQRTQWAPLENQALLRAVEVREIETGRDRQDFHFLQDWAPITKGCC